MRIQTAGIGKNSNLSESQGRAVARKCHAIAARIAHAAGDAPGQARMPRRSFPHKGAQHKLDKTGDRTARQEVRQKAARNIGKDMHEVTPRSNQRARDPPFRRMLARQAPGGQALMSQRKFSAGWRAAATLKVAGRSPSASAVTEAAIPAARPTIVKITRTSPAATLTGTSARAPGLAGPGSYRRAMPAEG